MELQQLSMIVNDIDYVSAQVQEIFENHIQPKLPVSMAEEPVVLESFEQALKTIRQEVPAVQQSITELITRRCVNTLSVNVKNISARYGDEPPREASHFVPLILEPLSEYIAGPGAVLTSSSRETWSLEVIKTTTKQYSSMLEARLRQVTTLESNAGKFKGVARSKGSGFLNLPSVFNNTERLPDADKIRLQCVLDVQQFKAEVSIRTPVLWRFLGRVISDNIEILFFPNS